MSNPNSNTIPVAIQFSQDYIYTSGRGEATGEIQAAILTIGSKKWKSNDIIETWPSDDWHLQHPKKLAELLNKDEIKSYVSPFDPSILIIHLFSPLLSPSDVNILFDRTVNNNGVNQTSAGTAPVAYAEAKSIAVEEKHLIPESGIFNAPDPFFEEIEPSLPTWIINPSFPPGELIDKQPQDPTNDKNTNVVAIGDNNTIGDININAGNGVVNTGEWTGNVFFNLPSTASISDITKQWSDQPAHLRRRRKSLTSILTLNSWM